MSDIISVLPNEPRKALVALAAFRFLTPKQFVNLGVAASETVMRDYVLARLEKRARPLAKSYKIGSFLPKVHYLTKHGADELEKLYRLEPGTVTFPKGQVNFSPVFAPHRFAQVDFHIGVRQWALSVPDAEFDFGHMDFETDGSPLKGNRVRKSQITIPGHDTPIVPDGIFGVTFKGNPLLYLLEIHRTTQTRFVAMQIKKYLDVLATNAANFKYGMSNVPTYVCSVHEKPNVLRGTKAQLMADPDYQHFKHLFLFNTIDQVRAGFSEGWHEADGTERYPFPTAKQPVPGDVLESVF